MVQTREGAETIGKPSAAPTPSGGPQVNGHAVEGGDPSTSGGAANSLSSFSRMRESSDVKLTSSALLLCSDLDHEELVRAFWTARAVRSLLSSIACC